MASTTNPKTIRLKLLIDNSSASGKVVFAEAGKDFVDFLFSLLELPLGIVLALLDDHGMGLNSGPLAKIHESVKNLDNSYLQTSQTKESLLRPKATCNVPAAFACRSPVFSPPVVVAASRNVFVPPVEVVNAAPSSNVVEGYVKGLVTYMVMDDLTVKPMSTISSVTNLLNTLSIKDVGCLQEKTVEVNTHKILKAVYHSTTVLTDVFLTDTSAGPFQFSSNQQNQSTPENPFQESASLDFDGGGSFSLGSSNIDKPSRKVVRLKHKIRRK